MSHPVVAVYARTPSGRWELAGHADLLLPRMLLADDHLAAAVAAHHMPVETVAHLSWRDGHDVSSELIDIRGVGPIGSWQGHAGGTGLELDRPSAADPIFHPPGPGGEGFWCVLFPWASFCG
jgi:hypothetical protein